MITIEVNNRRINAKPGEMLLQVLNRSGITVPTLCNWDGLTPSGHCRLCLVEIEALPYLVPSCSTPVNEGMKVRTYSKKVQEAREIILDLILANHPPDCVHCSVNGKCELQNIAAQFGSDNRLFKTSAKTSKLDDSSDSIVRDLAKCVLCGRCIRICSEIQDVHAIDWIGRHSETHVGTSYDRNLLGSDCQSCGQCIPACPTSALRIKSSIESITKAIHDPARHVVAMVAPSVTVTIGEEFGYKPGTDITKSLNAALASIGFDKVFDNAYAFDLEVMELSALLAEKIKSGGKGPLIRACTPATRHFIEKNFPEFSDLVSKCKPGEQIHGTLVKTYYAEKYSIDPDSIFAVAITPCTAAKSDIRAQSSELRVQSSELIALSSSLSAHISLQEVDAVLTPAELIKIIRSRGIDINSLLPENASAPFDERSTAGMLCGVSGGFSEAVARTTYKMLCGDEYGQPEISAIRGTDGRKETKISIPGHGTINLAVTGGLKNARLLLEDVRKGRIDFDFIEINACPNGCISGGGEPVYFTADSIKRQMKALYSIDRTETIRQSHRNRLITKLYEEFLETPMSKKSSELLYIAIEK